jgi:hypothetical protein
MALLELIKSGEIIAKQKSAIEPIVLFRNIK